MDVSKAAKLQAEGKSYREIAKELGVSKSTVGKELKSFLNPTWQTISGHDRGPIDAYGAIQAPEISDLLALYSDTVYSCTDWLSNNVSITELKVYVQTWPGQKSPRCLTAPVIKSPARHNVPHAKLEQVLEHPICSLLEFPNPEMSRKDFLKYLDSQLSLAGNCYVEIYREEDGLPCHLWPLKTQYVRQAADPEKGYLVGYWYEERTPPRFIKKDDVIHFKLLDPSNPYAEGTSPVRGLYERILLSRQELSYLNSLFRNQARPDQIISVKGATPEQLERIQKEFSMRNRQGAIGGPMAIDGEDMEVKPLSWAPKDLLGTELYKWTKLQIVNAFGLNISIFDTESSNRATADTARYLAQINAVLPRLVVIEECLNRRLVPAFDKRLLLAFDSPVEEDREFELKERTTYLDKKVWSINEVRKRMGEPPVPWGDGPEEASPKVGGSSAAPDEAQTSAPITNDLRSTVGGLQAIAALQQTYYSGQVPREAAVANVRILFGFTPEESEALFPAVAPKKLTQEDTPAKGEGQ